MEPSKAAEPHTLERRPAVVPPEGTKAAMLMKPASMSSQAAPGALPVLSLPYSLASSASASGMWASSHRRGHRPKGRLGQTAKPCTKVDWESWKVEMMESGSVGACKDNSLTVQ